MATPLRQADAHAPARLQPGGDEVVVRVGAQDLVLAHPPPVTDHASIFHHAGQAPDEDRHGPGTTAQTPRRNLAVDTVAGGEAANGKPLIRPEQDTNQESSL